MDLMFTNEDEEVVEWFEHLEERLIELIYEKREIWFQNEMDKDDIENFFNPICRAFRGGKFHLIRLQIPKNKTASSQYHCNVYDENENIVAIQDLNDTHTIIPCIEVQGIKFSARNFQLELVGKQIMLLNNKPIFNSCVIKRNNTEKQSTPYINEHNVDNNVDNEDDLKPDIPLATIDINSNKSDTGHDNLSQVEQDESTTIIIEDSLGKTDNETRNEPIDKTIHETYDTDSQILQRSGIVKPTVEDVKVSNIDSESIKGLQKNIVAALTESDSEDDEPENKDSSNVNHLEENTPIISNSFDLEDITDNLNVYDERNIKLKKPNEVYYEIYKIAKGKAKQHKKAAITHYLEAKKIKNTYLMDDLDYSDESMDEDDDEDDEDENEKEDSNKIKNQINEIVEDLI
jgi:hypothetical protein